VDGFLAVYFGGFPLFFFLGAAVLVLVLVLVLGGEIGIEDGSWIGCVVSVLCSLG
jgi:hypothetical protein